jgi:hypothetical protein
MVKPNNKKKKLISEFIDASIKIRKKNRKIKNKKHTKAKKRAKETNGM